MLDSINRFLANTMSVTGYRSLIVRHMDWLATFEYLKPFTKSIEEHPHTVMGLRFPNRIGLAAGVDINGEAISAFGSLGFGFTEIGPVTSIRQTHSGNLIKNKANESFIIKRNEPSIGIDAINLTNGQAFRLRGGKIGISLADTTDECLFSKAYNICDYLSMVVTQHNSNLVLPSIAMWRESLIASSLTYKPVVIELDPDLSDEDVRLIAANVQKAGLDAIMTPACISNENALIAGHPVYQNTLHLIEVLASCTKLPLIAKGGIFTANEATNLISAGASLVEIGSALFYRGPQIVADIVQATALNK